MIIHQLSIFAENRPGSLARVTGILHRENINIRATTISTSDTFGVINLIVDAPDRAHEALKRAGLMVTLKNVIAVLIDDRPGGLDRLTQILFREGININNAYGFVLESLKAAVFVVDVDQLEKAQSVIDKENFKMLDMKALSSR
ncbi:MAG: ACT domain-containing protein [Syntrophales bacterium]|nr:ACT domain-containing protein [Syntrophales bacterium]MDD5234101.1 ACT domain-containing protein [Syntrophales bacterium]MDD5532880.1 ACT domain-containing protein [Syntrophales bacterium]HPL63752.1 ACT domain-containing protein [Syntrophales bacterium]